MIIDTIIRLFISMIQAFFGMFPVITELPWGTDSIVTNAVGLFKGFALIFPPLQLILNIVLIYIGFKLMIMLWSVVPFFGKMVHRK
jgi:hypothetical protein